MLLPVVPTISEVLNCLSLAAGDRTEAIKALKIALRRGAIESWATDCIYFHGGKKTLVRNEPIDPSDWATLTVDWEKSKADSPGMLLPNAPWDGSFSLSGIYVKQEDVKRLWPEASANVAIESKLPSATDRTGSPGRPTPRHLVEAEFKRRADKGEAESSLREQARILETWLRQTHPDLARMTAATIENAIRTVYRDHINKA
ncbi:hypothetical protein [Bradyrhizobium sp. JYMT SZCCT0428]|uniref:hypothetical protein n=1 Tax=Bradyrhizobium sp. JYMT SZCCT0428 TaxID=2807673 RepID=UPI001BA6752B|nr:hypothetical protein [Bradyrhizobium sp. JYMT SZCCT0428]MBR1156589.1 hypothetical protein [Bradyrhizobium sp. JYMT SZCCT0428]